VAPGIGDLCRLGAAARGRTYDASSDLGQDLATLFTSPPTDTFQVKATFRLGD
jgi:hypothetical protein